MKSLDTNIIIRFLVNDDVKQGKLVHDMFADSEKSGKSFYVTTTVLLETLWVLKSVYDYSREEILIAVGAMIYLPVIEFEKVDAVQEFIREGKTTKLELDDLLVGLCAKHSGCESTLTLDVKAAKSPLFKLLK